VIFAVAAALLAIQAALVLTLVARPLDRAVVAAGEPARTMILVRVPEYVRSRRSVRRPGGASSRGRGRHVAPTSGGWPIAQLGAPGPLVCRPAR
jgi:hypothetical protein